MSFPLSVKTPSTWNLWIRTSPNCSISGSRAVSCFFNEITLDSPYRQIRYLKEHDLVHPMASLEEMGNRLGADRRCFGLYHRLMPDEPITFIEVALTRGIATSIHEIIENHETPGAAKKTRIRPYFIPSTTPKTAWPASVWARSLFFRSWKLWRKAIPA